MLFRQVILIMEKGYGRPSKRRKTNLMKHSEKTMDLNVMMVGFSGTGKTSYMGAMYEIFNQRGYNGFRIQAIDDAHHKAFSSIGHRLSKGIYPDNTGIRDVYEFDLLYNDENILRFNWTDYRGGVLGECGNDELGQVVSQIVKADALIVFLDTPRFVSEPAESVKLLARIQHLIQSAISHMRNDFLVVSFAMTKSDCIDDRKKLLKSSSWKRFNELTCMLSENEKVFGLASTTRVGSTFWNVEYPFLHSMSMGLRLRMGQLEQKCNKAREKANKYEVEGGVFDEIGTFFKKLFVDSDAKSKWDRAREESQKAKSLSEKFEKLLPPLERIHETITNADAAVWTF